uniref:Inositol-pentakisphosphate 2-kinase n=1 Tax=Panagrolaimus sp. JU765 TaxID=591449 RepID=A0AC34PZK0_9BILA
MVSVVKIDDYRSFCFRGEGGANFVISAKNAKTGVRIVWRLAKHKKSGQISVKPKCHITNAYMENLIAPLVPERFLIKPKIVIIPLQHVHHLAKIPAMRFNNKIESFKELTVDKDFNSAMSVLPLNVCAMAINQGIRYLAALEMPDATCIAKRLGSMFGPTITVELKPKQGFLQSHPGISAPFCNNCILQIEKWKSAAYDKMYDFCPLDLYSGDFERMKKAINSLIHDPHRNLRIFVNGNTVHSDEEVLSEEKLNQLLFPDGNGDVDSLTTAICQVLAGIDDDVSEFELSNESVLKFLLNVQLMDPIGIVTAHELYQSLSFSQQRKLHDKTRLMRKSLDSFVGTVTHAVGLLERYFFAATLKDCSLMLSLRQVSPEEVRSSSHAANIIKVRQNDPLYFAYSIKIVDLDPKTPKNLINAYQRFMDGVRIIQENPSLHKPCISLGKPSA